MLLAQMLDVHCGIDPGVVDLEGHAYKAWLLQHLEGYTCPMRTDLLL